MRKRVMLVAAPLCIVAIAASVAVAAPTGAEHATGPKLDKLHAGRPTAASDSVVALPQISAGDVEQAINDVQVFLRAATLKSYLDQLTLQAYLDAVTAADAAASQAAPRPVRWVYSSSNPGDVLSCIRQRESGGNYAVYNAGGSGAAGAYQFMPSTWNSTAAASGRPDLVGVDPAQASPADQDAMASALYAQQGAAPWGGGC